MKTGALIVYTSADSVFQIAAHEDVVSIEELYRVCLAMRRMLDERDDFTIGRVIARPFTGSVGAFERTSRRKDFSLAPPGETVLDILSGEGREVVAIGKVGDIFSGRGITREIHTASNAEGLERTMEAMDEVREGLIFTNLVDFDMLYGHRNDPAGYARCLEEADGGIGELMEELTVGDMLVVTADHGCDPTMPSTDHSREYVPLLVYGKGVAPGAPLGTRRSFADLGATVAEALGVRAPVVGESFLSSLVGDKVAGALM